jgi:hypothetical protein
MMETHYNNPARDVNITVTSGMRVYYTASLRRHDAGALSVGMDPTWRHISPPGQPEVVSEGHCISACTQQTVPQRGIKVFAVILHTHLIGTLNTYTFFALSSFEEEVWNTLPSTVDQISYKMRLILLAYASGWLDQLSVLSRNFNKAEFKYSVHKNYVGLTAVKIYIPLF